MTLDQIIGAAGPWFVGLTFTVLGLLALIALGERLWR